MCPYKEWGDCLACDMSLTSTGRCSRPHLAKEADALAVLAALRRQPRGRREPAHGRLRQRPQREQGATQLRLRQSVPVQYGCKVHATCSIHATGGVIAGEDSVYSVKLEHGDRSTSTVIEKQGG